MSRYFGLKSYTEHDAKYFKGRDSEISDILNILRRKNIVVLYSESAEGKSSLINAGLFPRLRQSGFVPVNVVFTSTEFSDSNPDFDRIVLDRINDTLKNINADSRLLSAERLPEVDMVTSPSFSVTSNLSGKMEWVSTSGIKEKKESLHFRPLLSSVWWLLRNFQLERAGLEYRILLVFDQFEEVFTQPSAEWTESFFAWLEELNSDNCPEDVIKVLDRWADKNDGILPDFNSSMNFKEIFSLRNEYMGEMDYWTNQRHFIPEIKNSRYCLKPLTITEAMEVLDVGMDDEVLKEKVLLSITGLTHEEFASARKDLPQVPAMLLSVICSALLNEETSKREYLEAIERGDSNAMESIIYDVYRDIMRKSGISKSKRLAIEDSLIDDRGRRVRVKSDIPSLKSIGFQGRFLKHLKKDGIIKSSRINGDDYVEFVHDQLAKSIFNNSVEGKKVHRLILSIVSVLLVCTACFFLWVSRDMTFQGEKMEYKDVDRYIFAETIPDDPVSFFASNGGISDDSDVVNLILTPENNSPSANIKNCKSLRTIQLNLSTDRKNPFVLSIRNNPLLDTIKVAKGASNISLDISEDNGFCIVEIDDSVRNIVVRPRTAYTKIIPRGNSNCITKDGRVWNLLDSSIVYIPNQKINKGIFEFPDNFKVGALEYQGRWYVNSAIYKDEIPLDKIYTSNIHEIREDAFTDCPNLERVIIPNSITDIATNAFDDNCDVIFQRSINAEDLAVESSKIKKIRLPQQHGVLDLSGLLDINEIDSCAFRGSRLDSIILPPNLKIISDYAFIDCPNLKRVVIPESVTYIANNAFDKACDVIFPRNISLDDLNMDSTTIKNLRNRQFRGALDLNGLSGITKIGSSAFSGSRIDSIILPPNLKKISYGAFSNCPNLKRVVIPKSVTEIDKFAFDEECDVVLNRNISLDDLIVDSTTIRGLRIPQLRGILDLNGLSKIKSISSYAFNRTRLDSIILPQNLDSIYSFAFVSTPNLKQVVILNPATVICGKAFDGNYEIEMKSSFSKDEITQSKNIIERIDNNCLWRRDLIDLSYAANVKGIIEEAFYGCRADSIILPPNLVAIGKGAFKDCPNLRYIRIPASVRFMDENAFDEDCKLIFESPNPNQIQILSNIEGSEPYYLRTYRGTQIYGHKLSILNKDGQEKVHFYPIFYPIPGDYYEDSVLKFSDEKALASLREIHIPFPQPNIWRKVARDSSSVRLTHFTIGLHDSIKQNIDLYVPSGSKRNFENDPDYKAFKSIVEDSWLRRYEDKVTKKVLDVKYWMSSLFHLLITMGGIIAVIVFFYYSCKIRYRKEKPYASTTKVNIMAVANGLLMAIVAFAGFVAIYWWIWDLSDKNWLLTAVAGCIGALAALCICYYNIFPIMGTLLKSAAISAWLFIKRALR